MPSIREKTARLRRQHILEAAVRVFARGGFHRTTIRDIAKEAEVSDGTIYNVFENKTALLKALLDPLNEADGPMPLPDLGPTVNLHELITVMIRRRWDTFTPQTLDILRVVLSEALVDEDLRAIYLEQVLSPALGLPEAHFQTLVDLGHVEPVDVPMLLRALAAALLGFVMMRLVGDPPTLARWHEVPDRLADLFAAWLEPRAHRETAHGTP